jgi:hypothetical protein
MLFNSYPFIFVFFPLVLIGFFLIGKRNARAAAGFLALASLFFYGWWSVQALPLLLGLDLRQLLVRPAAVARAGPRRPQAQDAADCAGGQPGRAGRLQVRQLLP